MIVGDQRSGTQPTPDEEPAQELAPAAFEDGRYDADGDPTREESLSRLLGGGKTAIEGSIPPIAFLIALAPPVERRRARSAPWVMSLVPAVGRDTMLSTSDTTMTIQGRMTAAARVRHSIS